MFSCKEDRHCHVAPFLHRALVLVLVDEKEVNFADIRNVEYEILEQNQQIKVTIRTTDELLDSMSLNEDRTLLV